MTTATMNTTDDLIREARELIERHPAEFGGSYFEMDRLRDKLRTVRNADVQVVCDALGIPKTYRRTKRDSVDAVWRRACDRLQSWQRTQF